MSLTINSMKLQSYQYLAWTCEYIKGIRFEHHGSGVEEEQYCSHAEYCHHANPPSVIKAQILRYSIFPAVRMMDCRFEAMIALIASHAKNPIHRRALLRTVPARDQTTAGMSRYPR